MTILRTGSRIFTGRGGFTFIEVLLAISILSIGMVGVLRAYSTSVNAMEIAQYNIDAACLLEAVMGGVEEQFISQRGLPEGRSEAVSGAYSDIKIDTTRPGRWQWDIEVRTTGLQAFKTIATAALPVSASAPAPAPETKSEPVVIYSLDEVKVTTVNPGCIPARRVSVVTYMEKYAESGSV